LNLIKSRGYIDRTFNINGMEPLAQGPTDPNGYGCKRMHDETVLDKMRDKKEHNKQYYKEWYLKNRESVLQKQREKYNYDTWREYQLKNKEHIKEYKRQWFLKNKVSILYQQKMYRAHR